MENTCAGNPDDPAYFVNLDINVALWEQYPLKKIKWNC